MTLIEFIKSQLSKNTQLGDLAKDIQGDKEFPADKSEEEIISYLNFKTRYHGTNPTFKRFLKAYKKIKDKEKDHLDLDTNFALLRTENWNFYKNNFPVDKVILVGLHSDFYKAYCIDSTNKKAIYFNIKSKSNLDDITIIDESRINIGNLSQQVSVENAINLLESCTYSPPASIPDKERFKELLEFLKVNN